VNVICVGHYRPWIQNDIYGNGTRHSAGGTGS